MSHSSTDYSQLHAKNARMIVGGAAGERLGSIVVFLKNNNPTICNPQMASD